MVVESIFALLCVKETSICFYRREQIYVIFVLWGCGDKEIEPSDEPIGEPDFRYIRIHRRTRRRTHRRTCLRKVTELSVDLPISVVENTEDGYDFFCHLVVKERGVALQM